MRWTRGGAHYARRRKHSRGRPSRVVLISRRWDQACRRRACRRWRLSSPALQGEREAAVNTIARGMPVVSAEPVVTATCFLPLQAGHGCGQHPAFPAPSCFGGDALSITRAWTCRGNEKSWPLIVIARSEATTCPPKLADGRRKQSMSRLAAPWIASSLSSGRASRGPVGSQ